MKAKISKRKALSLFKKNRIIYLKPSKLSEQCMDTSPWFGWFKLHLEEYDINIIDTEYHFKRIINEYYYYNCNDEVGNVVNFYYYE